jgi:signal transduction histidine kinase
VSRLQLPALPNEALHLIGRAYLLGRAPAYLVLSQHGTIQEAGGALAHYQLDITLGASVYDLAWFHLPAWPQEPVVWPDVLVADGLKSDISLIPHLNWRGKSGLPAKELVLVLLTDSEEAERPSSPNAELLTPAALAKLSALARKTQAEAASANLGPKPNLLSGLNTSLNTSIGTDLVALEWVAGNRLRLVSTSSDWFEAIFAPDRFGIINVTHFAFLENFLLDAQAHWASGLEGKHESGVWLENLPTWGDQHHELPLEASALRFQERSLLLIEVIGDFSEQVAVLQAAREHALEFEVAQRTNETLRHRLRALAHNAETLAAGMEAAQAESQAKNDLIAGVSHDLRTPLNAVIGFSDLLKAQLYGPLNPKQMEYIEDIRVSGEHLLTLVNDILDFSKSEAGRLNLAYNVFELAPILEECLKVVHLSAQEAGLHLRSEIEPALALEADAKRVRQIVMNLLSNAIKFTLRDGQVWLRAHSQGNRLLVSVSDTGIGIADEDQGKLFAPFVQVGRGRNQGTGLGLALSQRLAKLHGGQIRLESHFGSGSTFTLDIPIKPPTKEL